MTGEYDRVREKIAIKILQTLKEAMGFGGYKGEHWGMMTQHERDIYLGMADVILREIPELCIKADDQSLPPRLLIPGAKKANKHYIAGWDDLAKVLPKLDFVRVVRK
jgi:hypothetical protein